MNPISTESLSFKEWLRFWSFVEKGVKCWNWTAVRHHSGGYGIIRWRGVKTHAHRLSYQMSVGPVATDLYVLHKCDNPACVRPDHLFTGDQDANMQDRKNKGHYRAKTHCRSGHAMTGENVVIKKIKSWNGKIYDCRICATCNLDACRKSRSKAALGPTF